MLDHHFIEEVPHGGYSDFEAATGGDGGEDLVVEVVFVLVGG